MRNVPELLDSINAHHLLDEHQLTLVMDDLKHRFEDPQSLTTELLQRGWLTSFQIDKLNQGAGEDLTLGPYVILERIGEGGMGHVFKAMHRILKSVRAVKIIRPECLTNRDAVDRFYREIELVSRLNHPNIILAHDAGQQGDLHYFVMEYAPGKDLAQIVRDEGPLEISRACEVIRQTALGLQHAWEHRLVHRDIKPSNLLLTDSGVVKILDLGLARIRDHQFTPGTENDPLTPSGAVVGTPDFMAPEQCDDPTLVDIRADIYALGCAAYQLLTGSLVFPGGSFIDKLIHHRSSFPTPVQQHRPETPGEIVAIIEKMMAKKPIDRYQSPGEIAEDLARCHQVGQASCLPGSERQPGNPARPVEKQIDHTPSLSSFASEVMAELEEVEKHTREALAAQNNPGNQSRPRKRKLIPIAVAMVLLLGAIFLPWNRWLSSQGGAGFQPVSPASGAGILPVAPASGAGTQPVAPASGAGTQPVAPASGAGFQPVAPKLAGKMPAPLKKGVARARVTGPIATGKTWATGNFAHARALHRPGAELLHTLTAYSNPRQMMLSQDSERALLSSPTALHLLEVSPKPRLLQTYRGESVLGLLASPGAALSQSALSPRGDKIALATIAMSRERLRNNPPTTRYNLIAIVGSGEPHLCYGSEAEAGRDRQLHSSILSLCFSHDGKAIFAGTNGEVEMWSLDRHLQEKPRVRFRCQGLIRKLACSPEGKWLAAASSDGTIQIFLIDPEKKHPYCVFQGHTSTIRNLAFITEERLISTDSEGLVHLWRLSPKTAGALPPEKSWKHSADVRSLAVSPSGEQVLLGDGSGMLSLCDLETGKALWQEKTGLILAVDFSDDGQAAIYASITGLFRRWVRPLPLAHGRLAPE